MKRYYRDIIRFKCGENHRRTIFAEGDKFFVKWLGGMVEVMQDVNKVWKEI